MDAQLRARLKSFAESLQGPLGMIPLDRAIRADLDLFRMLKASGATWTQIAYALAATGARKPDGSILSADHLRSAVARQLKRNNKADSSRVCNELRNPPQTRLTMPKKPENRSELEQSALNSQDPLPQQSKLQSQKNNLIIQQLQRTKKLREI